ncbi:MAG TPA: glucose 1-dehydrogenase [Rhizomicrobium sp.]|nr:glucose 1-dehydrogenase [Rhizomicrobium sp.]
MGRLENRIAIVTGAASGIGRGCALALAHEGARVVLGDVDEKGMAETCAAIKSEGGMARSKLLDVASEASWTSFVDYVAREFGALHVLVNNAGICISRRLLDMSFEAWRRQMSINLDGVFLGCKAALPLMARSGLGAIINVSSVAGIKGIPGMTGYCASKGGVRLFTKALALECAQAKNNIRVNSIHPGAIETPIWLKLGNDGVLPARDDGRNSDAMEEVRAAGAAATPLGHAGVPADIAAGVVYLASDAAGFVTGTELIIDGGVMAG